jgi:superfamily II DNA or RNA helicase
MAERDPEKQKAIEEKLSAQKSKMYDVYSDKIKEGKYRRNRNTLRKNKLNVEKKLSEIEEKVKSGTAKQQKGYEGKIQKLQTLREIMSDETNVEEDSQSVSSEFSSSTVNSEDEYIPEIVVPVGKTIHLTQAVNEQAPFEDKLIRSFTTPILNQDFEEYNVPVQKRYIQSYATPIEETSPLTQENKEVNCQKLYDPCTKEPIESISALEKRLFEIKQQRNAAPIGLYGIQNNTSNYEFLRTVFCNKDISLDDMVSFKLEKSSQVGSDIFEVLCRFYVLFGGLQGVNPVLGGSHMFLQNIETGKEFSSVKEAFEQIKCKATSESGISDITLKRMKEGAPVSSCGAISPYCETPCDTDISEEEKTILISVKWYKDEKSPAKYDIEKLTLAVDKVLSVEQKPHKICVFLKSRTSFEKTQPRLFNKMVKAIPNQIKGWDEDIKPFLNEKRAEFFAAADRLQISPEDYVEEIYLVQPVKPSLNLYLHQDIITQRINDLFEKPIDYKYVIGVLPRGGKTNIAGGIIREFSQRNQKPLNILWITAAPTETLIQVKCDLLEKFQDFSDYTFLEVKAVKDISKSTNINRVYFVSNQLLVQHTKRRKMGMDHRGFLEELISGKVQIDLIFFDEAHAGGSGDMTKEVVESIYEAYKNQVPLIFLTATYLKILIDYHISSENIFIWDYTDVLQIRGLLVEDQREQALKTLKDRFHEETVSKCIKKRLGQTQTYENMAKPYLDYPDLYFMTCELQPEVTERFAKQNLYKPEAGFSLSAIFGVPYQDLSHHIFYKGKVRKDAWKVFVNIEATRNLVTLLTPTHRIEEFQETEYQPGGEPIIETIPGFEPSILGRIGRISFDVKTRFNLENKPTIMMFLPEGQVGSKVEYLLPAWASLLLQHQWWRERYEIAYVTGGSASDTAEENEYEVLDSVYHLRGNNIKEQILTLERRLHCEKQKGLVILTGKMLSMGVSLNCVDVVCLLNESKSPDSIIQKMYRALTPSPGKKAAFVVDLNPVRSLSAVYGYTRASHEKIHSQNELLDIVFSNYSWDGDIFDIHIKRGESAKLESMRGQQEQLLEYAKQDDEYKDSFKNIQDFERKLVQNIKEHANISFLEQSLHHFGSVSNTGQKFTLTDGSKVSIQKGVLRIKKPTSTNEDNNEEESEEDLITIDSFAETVADFIKYLALTSTKNTLEDAIEEFKEYESDGSPTSLQKNVFGMVKARTTIKGTLQIPTFIDIFTKAIKDFSPYSSKEVFRQMKEQITTQNVKKDKILQIIHRRLTPRNKQKKDFGEVFTPIELIEEMLSHLPESVWKDHTLKWLDPANGIGNFPVVVFYKLDNGLKGWEKDDKKRRKHIIENMLFMIEIQSSNSRIARNIFQELCSGCTPNIWTQNSLTVTRESLEKHGWPMEFDVIMGNPPFNPPKTETGSSGNSIWQNFVMKYFYYLSKNGVFCFVHPPGWKKPTDELFKPEKFADDDYTGQVRQGQVWQVLKEAGVFSFIYTNDQRTKSVGVEYLEHFPAVDYYIYQKDAHKGGCDTKNVFLGEIKESSDVRLNYDLKYLPNLITKETQDILNKVTSKAGDKCSFKVGFDPRGFKSKESGLVKYIYQSSAKGPVYQFFKEENDNVNISKVVINYGGGIDGFYCDYIDKSEQIGVLHMTMYQKVDSTEGKRIAKFFKSDIVKFIFLITQFSIAPNTKNEPLVANSITIPSEGVSDYYKFFDIQEHKKYIEDMLKHYESFKAPKRLAKTEKSKEKKEGGSQTKFNKTRKIRK